MRFIVGKPEVVVIDDFLDERSFRLVWAFIQSEEFEHVHRVGWVKAWRLSDGVPLRGDVTLSHQTKTDTLCSVFPTGKGIDLLIGQILEILDSLVEWVGHHGTDWSHFFCRPYLYAAGSGLSWHRDNQNSTTGAFTFYCHPTWNVQWAGELLVAPIESKDLHFPETSLLGEEDRFLGTHLDNRPENDALLETGAGTYVLPKPNRLVIIPAGVLHCIKKVDPTAGSAVRATLQGTFMFPDRDLVDPARGASTEAASG